MNLSRRELLSAGAAIGASAALFGCAKSANANRWLVSATSNGSGSYYAVALTTDGNIINKVALPERAHDALALPHKPGHALIIARRPDRFLIEIDFASGQVTHQVASQEDTHFYGHGALSADHMYLFTTENHFADGRGLLVVRDSQTYQVLERYDSGGIGPHEAALMPDGKTLVIANGGIKTHPITPRVKLNLNDMQPNLAYLDIESGKIIDSFAPPYHQQSLRHLSVADDGSVYVGVQYQGKISDVVPLVYAHRGESELQAFAATSEQWLSMRQYTASVMVDRKLVAITCPRANKITYWNRQTKEFVGRDSFKDTAGLTYVQGKAYASNGLGQLMQLSSKQITNVSSDQLKFDNHMTQIQAV